MSLQTDAADLFADAIRSTRPPEAVAWFDETRARLRADPTGALLARAFALAPRRLGREPLPVDPAAADAIRPGWDPAETRTDEAARIALLLAASGNPAFFDLVDDLARTADAGELIAILRGLPLYPEPERFLALAREGTRSGITPVFEAVAHRSPFPREVFDEDAWNQMVLKALFIGSSLEPIQGLDERGNPQLAAMLVDYAEERWSAARPVPPELWRCVAPHADERGRAALRRAGRGSDADPGDASRHG